MIVEQMRIRAVGQERDSEKNEPTKNKALSDLCEFTINIEEGKRSPRAGGEKERKGTDGGERTTVRNVFCLSLFSFANRLVYVLYEEPRLVQNA